MSIYDIVHTVWTPTTDPRHHAKPRPSRQPRPRPAHSPQSRRPRDPVSPQEAPPPPHGPRRDVIFASMILIDSGKNGSGVHGPSNLMLTVDKWSSSTQGRLKEKRSEREKWRETGGVVAEDRMGGTRTDRPVTDTLQVPRTPYAAAPRVTSSPSEGDARRSTPCHRC